MDHQTLNLYLDGILSLSSRAEDALPLQRKTLIEEAAYSGSIQDLLEEWLWLYRIDMDSALQCRLWLGFNYQDLGSLFMVSDRDIAQALKNQRAAMLPPYHASDQLAAPVGFSCFMVEQHLSAWIDSEISELRTLQTMDEHLRGCLNCRIRLQAYRRLQTEVLQKKSAFNEVTTREWEKTVSDYRNHTRKRMLRLAGYLLVVFVVLGSFGWFLWSKPEKMPNIYEIRD